MTAITNAPRAMWAQPEAPQAPRQAPRDPQPTQRPATPAAGSIEDLGRQLLEETSAARCVAYRRSRTGQLIWQHEVAADESPGTGTTLADQAAAAGRASVQVTRPVRDAFGQIIGVIQTRESSDPTF